MSRSWTPWASHQIRNPGYNSLRLSWSACTKIVPPACLRGSSIFLDDGDTSRIAVGIAKRAVLPPLAVSLLYAFGSEDPISVASFRRARQTADDSRRFGDSVRFRRYLSGLASTSRSTNDNPKVGVSLQ